MLKSLGTILFNNTRHNNYRGNHVLNGSDIVGRIGGEEFLIVINNTTMLLAYNTLNNIRKIIESSHIYYEDKLLKSCTISFGMYFVGLEELKKYKNATVEQINDIRNDILKKSDEALYVSKNNGRNQINIYGINNRNELEKRIKEEKEELRRTRSIV